MNRRMLSRVGAIVAAGIVLAGLSGGLMAQKINANSPKPGESRLTAQSPNPPVNSQFVDANTKFGFKLFSEILKQDSKKNVFVSPTSVAIALFHSIGIIPQQSIPLTIEGR